MTVSLILAFELFEDYFERDCSYPFDSFQKEITSSATESGIECVTRSSLPDMEIKYDKTFLVSGRPPIYHGFNKEVENGKLFCFGPYSAELCRLEGLPVEAVLSLRTERLKPRHDLEKTAVVLSESKEVLDMANWVLDQDGYIFTLNSLASRHFTSDRRSIFQFETVSQLVTEILFRARSYIEIDKNSNDFLIARGIQKLGGSVTVPQTQASVVTFGGTEAHIYSSREEILEQEEPPAQVKVIQDSITVGVDARVLRYGFNMRRGIGRYTIEHLRHVALANTSAKIIMFSETDDVEGEVSRLFDLPNISFSKLRSPEENSLSFFHIPDPISIVPGYDSPFLIAPRIPLSVLFYDLIPIKVRQFHFDNWDEYTKGWYLRRLEEVKEFSDLLMGISESTCRDIQEVVQPKKAEICSILAGFHPLSGHQGIKKERTQKFLSVGGLDGHKNFQSSLKAFEMILPKYPDAKLLVAGCKSDHHKQRFYDQVCRAGNQQSVQFLGYVSDEQLASLYSEVSALLFPSLYEGFGFPILEAMAHGCPVICSNAASLPEVAGDAAIKIDVLNTAAFAKKLEMVLTDKSLRDELSRKGIERSHQFSWMTVASKTWDAWARLNK